MVNELKYFVFVGCILILLVPSIFIAQSFYGTGIFSSSEFSSTSRPNFSDSPTAFPTLSTSNTFEILEVFDHDSNAFTQGLVYSNGYFYESTGLTGTRSSLRKVEISTGKVVKQVLTNSVIQDSHNHFAEGLCLINNTLLQLTWKARELFLFDADTFEHIGTHIFSTKNNQGWGIAYTNDKDYFDEPLLVVSDGSSYIHFWDPVTLEEIRRIQVKDAKAGAISNLNELEFVKGELLANIWYDTRIVRINVETGAVIGYFDFSYDNLPFGRQGEVLNGIAYDKENDVTYVTGKLWKYMLKVKLFF